MVKKKLPVSLSLAIAASFMIGLGPEKRSVAEEKSPVEEKEPDYTSRVPKYTFADTLEEQEAQLKTAAEKLGGNIWSYYQRLVKGGKEPAIVQVVSGTCTPPSKIFSASSCRRASCSRTGNFFNFLRRLKMRASNSAISMSDFTLSSIFSFPGRQVAAAVS